MRKLLSALAAASLLLPVATTVPASAEPYKASSKRHTYHRYPCRRSKAETGAVVGGVGGAVAGAALGGGVLGTVAGGVGGVIAGKAIDKTLTAKRRGCR